MVKRQEFSSGIYSGQIVRNDAAELANLPAPGTEFEFKEVDGISDSTWRRATEYGFVRLIEYRATSSKNHTWMTTPNLWRKLQDLGYIDEDDNPTGSCGNGPLPCGGGFVNEGGVLRCKHCDTEYPREALA